MRLLSPSSLVQITYDHNKVVEVHVPVVVKVAVYAVLIALALVTWQAVL